jgi:hypothetical protein
MVGSLIHVMMDTRPNLTFVVNTVSQFMSKVGPPYWMAMKRIMRYLKGTLDFKLCFRGKDIAFKGCRDTDWTKPVQVWRDYGGVG